MPKLSILMHRDLDTGEWYVDRVETESNKIRTQTRFGTPYPMKLAFSEEMVAFLQDTLPRTSNASAVVVDEKLLAASQLCFSNLRIIAQRALAGLQSVSIRVHDVFGNVARIYAPKLLLEVASPQPEPKQLERRSL